MPLAYPCRGRSRKSGEDQEESVRNEKIIQPLPGSPSAGLMLQFESQSAHAAQLPPARAIGKVSTLLWGLSISIPSC